MPETTQRPTALKGQSDWIYGIHEPGGEEYMLIAERPGWIVFTEAVGHDVEDRSGLDFSTFTNDGLGVICRINHGYEPEGTLPHSSLYEQFARRVANFVGTSQGCKVWVIGNEMNYAVERPGIVIDWSRHQSSRSGPPELADPMRRGLPVRYNVLPDHSTEIRTTRSAIVNPGEVITPEMYARAYKLCRDAIRRIPGHEDDLVLVGAVCPWNTQSIYPGNPNGDWILYFRHILETLGAEHCDGFALHTATHGADPALIASTQRLPPPFQGYHEEFRVFTDFMAAVPNSMRHLPAFITQMDQTLAWADRNEGWVQKAFAEVDGWNRAQELAGSPQRIRCAALYRWPRLDRWYIEGKSNVVEDFLQALDGDYRWRREDILPEETTAPVVVTPAESDEPPIDPRTDPKAEAARKRKKRAQKQQEPPVLPRYRIEWMDDRFPARMGAGQVITVPLTLRNAGSITWRWSGGNPFRLAYRYFRNRKPLELPADRDVRTDITQEVPTNGEITVEMRIALPMEPGNYTLEVDMVHEGVTWFKEQESPVLTRWITVEPAKTEAPEKGARVVAEEPKLNLPVPLFTDVTQRLPHADSPYARRSLAQIKYLVICSTGANPRLSLERIARAHVAAGYPGIAYDFVIDAAGQTYRTSELEAVAQPDQPWSEQGVNIALAGNFTAAMPSLPQIDAAGRLCSWLAQNLGLGPDAIVGLGELTRTDNPGAPFYRGPKWKEMITRQVQLHQAALGIGAADAERALQAVEQAERLEQEGRSLRAQIEEGNRTQAQLMSEAAELRAEVIGLRQQISVLSEGGVRQPRMVNAAAELPREAHRYRRREAGSVKAILVNHTGAPANTPISVLAQEHRHDWPGLLFDFVIDAQGNITQTQPLNEVVDTDEPWLANAYNLALAGDFEEDAPSRAQINAAGSLIAWLLDHHPQLTEESIRGLRDVTPSSSPGAQFLEGRRWRDDLIAAVRRALGTAEQPELEASWRTRLAAVEARASEAERLAAELQASRKQLEADNAKLQGELAANRRSATYVIPKPSLRNLVDQLPRHPTLRYERRSLSQITHIAVHHTAAPPTLGSLRIAELHIQADSGRGKESWPGIGYHYFIHADGSVEQTNALETICFHVYRHNQYSVGIVLAGSFMNGKIPTSAQLRSAAHLVAWLMQELKIPLARVWGHREFPENITVCPGSEWTQGNRWRDLLFERIAQVQEGTGVKQLRHYLLLPTRQALLPVAEAVPAGGMHAPPAVASAVADLQAVAPYVARFQPVVGYSIDDARNAEFVTILGSTEGIPASVDHELREHGCHVERLAGDDDADVAHLLTTLAQEGRRFRGFEVDF
jgi:N-acetyl-anhydromuramyl-L-alanine amidase AmpD